tara:strand:- start:164 stop:493 length:330 start_codon:yes stop_codon:yes gene_type:complete
MYRFVLAILFCFAALSVNAQTKEQTTKFSPRQAPIPVCGTIKNMHAGLTENGSLSVVKKLDDYHTINLYTHEDGMWALILVNVQGVGCILQTGIGWQNEDANTPMEKGS